MFCCGGESAGATLPFQASPLQDGAQRTTTAPVVPVPLRERRGSPGPRAGQRVRGDASPV